MPTPIPDRSPDAGSQGPTRRIEAAGSIATALVPGALVVAFGFRAGGFFPDSVAAAAIGLALLLVLRVTSAPRPFAGLSVPLAVAGGALALYAAWTLASSSWSDAVGRALLEYDRALLYLLAFLVMGAAGREELRVRWLVRGLAAGVVVVCAAGLVTRVLPDVWTVAPTVANDRLSFPVSYWNALGLLAAIGVILCAALTSDLREAAAVRVAAAAALPVVAVALLFTFSRGAIGMGVVGLAVLLVVARPRALLSGLLVAVPTVAIAVMAAYDAELLAGSRPTGPAAVDQGHTVALVVIACVVAAAIGRAVLLRLDARVAEWRAPAWLGGRRRVVGVVVVVATVAVAAVAIAGSSDALHRQYDRFVSGDAVSAGEDQRARLTNVGNNGRIEPWRVALDTFADHPVRGAGAGTFPLRWERERPVVFQVEDAHSLYMEVPAELGLVGLVLLILAIVVILGGFLVRARGPDRVVHGALFAAGTTWFLHAGIDWDWEMPVVTLWFFAAGGMVLAARPSGGRALAPVGRILIALSVLLVAAIPAQILLTEGALDESREAFARGDCPAAIDRGLDAIGLLASRADPYVIVGYCDVRIGLARLGVRALEKAVERDPANWETHYGLALARGAAGLDPRGAAGRALRRNPRERLALDLVRRFDTEDPRTWRRRALRARLPSD
ncbi:MAG: O-antigen ligase family protein [Solirubrobacterales bacterium]|nr:O-antigen ligase family protein [Solirubrobacterales bacterium]